MTDLELLIRDKYDGDAHQVSEEDKGRLAQGEPLAYVIGWIPFLGVRVDLSSKPLIPRPETEWWTELLCSEIGDKTLRVLDLCAGSGAVGLAVLKHCPNAQVTFAELKPEQLETIEKSIRENGLDAPRAHVVAGDLFQNLADEHFDVIACNPPYIPSGRELSESVSAHEPHEALFSGKDGLDLIRRIATDAPAHLTEYAVLWLETDITNIEDAQKLLLAGGAHRTDIRNDLYDRPRLVVAYY